MLIGNLLKCKTDSIEVYDVPGLYEEMEGRLPVDYLSDSWIVENTFHGMNSGLYKTRIKRVLDVGLSLAGLIVFSPVLLFIAITLKTSGEGPVIYKQKRVGRGDTEFDIFKFRSMIVDAEPNGAEWAEENDNRVTATGRILRRFRLDELPQLWNVLKGDMSFVGPRPERPEFVKELESKIPYYPLRQTVLPGMTGWAQVNYNYGASVADAVEKLEYDIFYIKNMSALLDFSVILKTLRVVIFGKI